MSRLIVRFAAWLAAVLLISASAGFGAFFAWSMNLHHAPMLAAFAVMMALGLELAKPVAVHALLEAIRSFRLGQALALAIVATVAVGYSLTAELQLMARSRADAVAERAGAATSSADVRERRDRMLAELKALPPARPAAELEPLIAAKLADKRLGDCEGTVDAAKLRLVCADVAALRSEAARADRRAALAAKLDAAEAALASAPAAKPADPSALALATYLAALGWKVDPGTLGDWLVLVAVFALEVGSMFALVLVQASGLNAGAAPPAGVQRGDEISTPAAGPAVPSAPETGCSLAVNAANAAPVTPCSPEVAELRIPDEPRERLVQLLTAQGGAMFGSQRTIAKALGISAGRVNALLAEMADAGRLQVTPSRDGTRISLPRLPDRRVAIGA